MNWVLFPLFGLRITEPNAWLNEPLFGDATLVSRKALQNHLGSTASPLLSHSKLSELLGPGGLDSIKLPTTQLVEIEPDSYIAVRNRKDASKNQRRANEIRALLSATIALRAKSIQTVSATPAQIAWFLAPREVVIYPTEPTKTQTSLAPQFNEHVLIRPLEVAQSDIRMSLEHGLVIPNNRDWPWDIRKTDAVCQLFLSSLNKFQRRLLNGALQIQEAGCAVSYEAQLQMAVAGLELLLNTRSFSDLQKMLKAFFGGKEQQERIEHLIGVRHRITHEGVGTGDEDGRTKTAAMRAITFGWLMLDIMCAFDKAAIEMSWDDYLSMLVAATDLDEKVSRITGDTSEQHQQALHKQVPTFVNFLTARQNV